MSAVHAAKAALRAAMASRRAALPEAVRSQAAQQAAKLLAASALGAPGTVVAGYMPIRGELDPGPLMAMLEAAGLRLSLPRVEGGALSFRAHGCAVSLVPGAYGILEPDIAAPVVRPAILLVPLLAFDRQGGRLGYGAGYYDRAIARLKPRLTVGLAYAAQEIETVPMEPHDRRLDLILTERSLIDCRAEPVV